MLGKKRGRIMRVNDVEGMMCLAGHVIGFHFASETRVHDEFR